MTSLYEYWSTSLGIQRVNKYPYASKAPKWLSNGQLTWPQDSQNAVAKPEFALSDLGVTGVWSFPEGITYYLVLVLCNHWAEETDHGKRKCERLTSRKRIPSSHDSQSVGAHRLPFCSGYNSDSCGSQKFLMYEGRMFVCASRPQSFLTQANLFVARSKSATVPSIQETWRSELMTRYGDQNM